MFYFIHWKVYWYRKVLFVSFCNDSHRVIQWKMCPGNLTFTVLVEPPPRGDRLVVPEGTVLPYSLGQLLTKLIICLSLLCSVSQKGNKPGEIFTALPHLKSVYWHYNTGTRLECDEHQPTFILSVWRAPIYMALAYLVYNMSLVFVVTTTAWNIAFVHIQGAPYPTNLIQRYRQVGPWPNTEVSWYQKSSRRPKKPENRRLTMGKSRARFDRC